MAGKKKNPNAQYALIGLIVALVACVATGLLGSANVLIGLGMFALEASQQDTLNLILQISLALLVIGLAVYAILAPDTIRRFLTGRQARYGSNSLILTLAVVGILFAANYLVFNNPGLLGEPWDLTEDKSNTLTSETLDVLDRLPEKVTATAFYTDSISPVEAQELLLKFKANSNGKFDYSFVNPDLDPIAAREAGVTGDGKILLQMGETKEVASFASETELVRTIIRLISPEARTVYFLQGHGEPGIDSFSSDVSYSIAKSTLESKNYTVGALNLLSTNSIPEDALAIIIAGPMKPVSQQEVNLLKEYVKNGGGLVVMQDPRFFTEFGDAADPLAQYLTDDWGVTLNEDIVIDLINTQNPFQAVSSQYNSHPITANLSDRYIVILPQARSVSITAQIENIFPTPLISTTEQSWGETQLFASETPEFDAEFDTLGPLNLAVAAENTVDKSRVVVFGNSLFATDEVFDAYGNGNMFINAVDWAAEQDDLLDISTRPTTERVFLPPAQIGFIILALISVVVIPGLVVVSGISSWIARRKRG
jgi:ABC-type uncharacterized transport system involved in gliding motility auxiliary subunit